jgi:hypothetical protein
MSLRISLFIAASLTVGSITTLFAGEQPTDDQPIRVTARAKAACMPDAMRLCRDAVPNVKNVLLCFGQHRDKISNRCRIVLASYGLQ